VIVTHNAFWLQGCPFAGTSPGDPMPAILQGLVDTYRHLAPDCLCLQEIQSADAADRTAAALGMRAAWCPGGALPQYGLAVLTPVPCEVQDWRRAAAVPERGWLTARVRGLLIANVHLPSGRHLGGERARVQRLEELRSIISLSPDVIVGDHNELPGGEVSRFLAGHGYLDLAATAGAGHLPTTHGNTPPNRIDYVWVRGPLATNARYDVIPASSFAAPRDTGKTLLSDHFPVTVRLEQET
jgi:endonuclease/exonuclease/phosphatase family metal-dependent hydrolase